MLLKRQSVTVDVSSIESAGTYTTGYRINYPTGVSGNSVSITGSTAQNVTYTVARRTERSVEVQGVFRGEVAEGYQREEFYFSPSTILIAGEESAVNQVDHALVTVTRDEPLSETFSGEMPFQLIGLDGTVLDLEELNLETDVNTVQVTLPVVQLKEVELTVDHHCFGQRNGPGRALQHQPGGDRAGQYLQPGYLYV